MQSETDLRGPASRLINSHPDVIILTNYIRFEVAARELRKLGYNGPKLSSLMTSEKFMLADGALENTISYGYESATPDFTERFKAKFGKEPWGIGADNAYDAVHLFARTVNFLKSDDPRSVAEALLQVKEYPGASGVFSIDADGGIERKPRLFETIKGQLVKLKE